MSGDASSLSIGAAIIRFTRNRNSTGRSGGAIEVKIVSSYLGACCKQIFQVHRRDGLNDALKSPVLRSSARAIEETVEDII